MIRSPRFRAQVAATSAPVFDDLEEAGLGGFGLEPSYRHLAGRASATAAASPASSSTA